MAPGPPTNTATPTSSGSSGVSGAAVGGAIGGGCVAVIILAFIAYKVRRRAKQSRERTIRFICKV